MKILTVEELEIRRKSLMDNGGIWDIRRRRRYHRIAAKYWATVNSKSAMKFARLHKLDSISGGF